MKKKVLLLATSLVLLGCASSKVSEQIEDNIAHKMKDIWYTFPVAMGENQAWITYNHGYAEVAKEDNRNIHLRIQVDFNNPTEYGMPTNDEFPVLASLEESLDNAIIKQGGVYIGRITVGGQRYFYYYLDSKEEQVIKEIDRISKLTNYNLKYKWESDPGKKKYWDELYPTPDDWQVIKDLQVLDVLSSSGDIKSKKREVQHWAFFDIKENASKFKEWALEHKYRITNFGPTGDHSQYLVQYSHIGTMNLGDITNHTITSNRKARELSGKYDGWETSVEKH